MAALTDIGYGDLVQYVVEGDSLDGSGDFVAFGRATGKLVRKTREGRATYLVRTEYDPADWDLLPDAIKNDHDATAMWLGSKDRIEFEWGGSDGRDRSGILAFIDDDELENAIDDPAQRLFKQYGVCPRCGDEGYWKMLALFCQWHGRFI